MKQTWLLSQLSRLSKFTQFYQYVLLLLGAGVGWPPGDGAGVGFPGLGDAV